MKILIEIYTGPNCYYCDMAKKLLQNRGLDYDEIELSTNPNKKEEMLKRSNGKTTVPQIFINQKHIGGFEELYLLDNKKKLSKKNLESFFIKK